MALRKAGGARGGGGDIWEGPAHVSSAWRVLELVQGAAFGLDVTEVQFDAGDHDLGKDSGAESRVTAGKRRR